MISILKQNIKKLRINIKNMKIRDDFLYLFGCALLFWDMFSVIKGFGPTYANFSSGQHSASILNNDLKLLLFPFKDLS